jgi:hypothetical protein
MPNRAIGDDCLQSAEPPAGGAMEPQQSRGDHDRLSELETSDLQGLEPDLRELTLIVALSLGNEIAKWKNCPI